MFCYVFAMCLIRSAIFVCSVLVMSCYMLLCLALLLLCFAMPLLCFTMPFAMSLLDVPYVLL